MARYIGTIRDEVFLFAGHRTGDVIYADGLDGPSAGSGTNLVFAGRGNDTVFGGYGRDMIHGGAGDDSLLGYGPAGPTPGAVNAFASRDLADMIDGGAGNDLIDGGGGRDRLRGGTGNDVIYGGSGQDTINAGPGDDIISSGAGGDLVWGGLGRDVFVYRYNPSASERAYDANGGTDIIFDFKPGTDRIDLRGYALRDGDVQFVDTAQGLELHFTAVYEQAQINLRGVHALQPGDIVYFG